MPMTGRIVSALSLIVVALGLAACGGDGGSTTTFDTDVTVTTTHETTTTSVPDETTALRVYFLLDGKVQPVSREVPKTQAVLTAAMNALLAGPTKAERDIGITTDFKPGGKLLTASVKDGVATIAVDAEYGSPGLAQLVYTATQFPTVKSVGSGEARYTRRSSEEYAPLILVESPLPFESVSSPIHATGTANAFEATFQYDVVGPAGKVLATHFVTATSGTGTRGTFDFTTKPFEASGDGALVVYELSAKDGSRINEVRIPLQLEP
jgi:hypothetical protein